MLGEMIFLFGDCVFGSSDEYRQNVMAGTRTDHTCESARLTSELERRTSTRASGGTSTRFEHERQAIGARREGRGGCGGGGSARGGDEDAVAAEGGSEAAEHVSMSGDLPMLSDASARRRRGSSPPSPDPPSEPFVWKRLSLCCLYACTKWPRLASSSRARSRPPSFLDAIAQRSISSSPPFF